MKTEESVIVVVRQTQASTLGKISVILNGKIMGK